MTKLVISTGLWRMMRVVSKAFALFIEHARRICDTTQVEVHFVLSRSLTNSFATVQ